MDKKLPLNEISGRKPLSGTYKVSFTVEIFAEDDLSLDDVVHGVASGFQGHPALEKLANMDVEKIVPKAERLKIGDVVFLTEDVQIMANVLHVEGHFLVGEKLNGMDEVGPTPLTITRGSVAIINKITREGAELIDFQEAVEVSLLNPETDEPFQAPVSVDRATVSIGALRKVEE